LTDKPRFVAIAGNIGVGKTHLTSLLNRRLGWTAFYEPVVDNPYLDDFYRDMPRWSFHLQIFFLAKRFEIHKSMSEMSEPCIQDRTIYEDREIFATTLYRQGYMTERDYRNYCSLFDAMTSFLRMPDLIVFLRAGRDSLIERILNRGRDCEKSISPDYLETLNEAYDEWIDKARQLTRVITIDTDRINLLDDESHIRLVVQEIKVPTQVEIPLRSEEKEL
jgi:deoxyadenosine/deoxycytidine kinase